MREQYQSTTMNGLPNKNGKSSIVKEKVIQKEENCCTIFS